MIGSPGVVQQSKPNVYLLNTSVLKIPKDLQVAIPWIDCSVVSPA